MKCLWCKKGNERGPLCSWSCEAWYQTKEPDKYEKICLTTPELTSVDLRMGSLIRHDLQQIWDKENRNEGEMSFACTNKNGTKYLINIHGWSLLLGTGEGFGWRAKGTKRPANFTRKQWSGSYVLNDGQVVTSEDAKAWGEAIAKALSAENKELLGFFSRSRLREFIAFCEAGGFEIR